MGGHDSNSRDELAGEQRAAGRRGHHRLVLAAAVLACALVLLLLAVPDHDGVPRASARTSHAAAARWSSSPGSSLPAASLAARAGVVVSIAARSRGSLIPDSFLGFSAEYWAMPAFERALPAVARVLSLVHVRGDRQFVLRVGGDSADRSIWDRRRARLPRWAYAVTPRWLKDVGRLVRRSGVHLILDLNLVTATPLAAAQWARAAEQQLPSGSIVGFEIGNEPDIYSYRYWLQTISGATLEAQLLPGELTAASYSRDFQAYAALLLRVAPKVPLIGPALSNPRIHFDWLTGLLAGPHPGLRTISVHRYPLAACARRRSAVYPTIARVLSERALVGVDQAVRPAVLLAHRHGLLLRMTELNSVTCGGLKGVSNTFATALWAPDALFELVRAGVDAVNVHVRPDLINGAFTIGRRGLIARPLLYGLILFARTLGPGAQLLSPRVAIERPLRLHLKVWAFRLRGGVLHVLLINKGSRAGRVRLRLPAGGAATVHRLLAPTVRSTSGVTLDGRTLGHDGRWQGPPRTDTITPGPSGYELVVPPFSAALVSSARPRTPR